MLTPARSVSAGGGGRVPRVVRKQVPNALFGTFFCRVGANYLLVGVHGIAPSDPVARVHEIERDVLN